MCCCLPNERTHVELATHFPKLRDEVMVHWKCDQGDSAHATQQIVYTLSATTAAGIFTGMMKRWNMNGLMYFLK